MRRLGSMKIILVISSLFALLLAAACGNSETETVQTPTQIPAGTSVAPTAAAQATSVPTAPVASARDLTKEQVLARALDIPQENLSGLKYGGIYRFANTATPPVLEPRIAQVSGMADQGRWFYEKIVAWAPDPSKDISILGAGIAEKFEISTDVKTYTFTLRKGIKWQNVAPVNGRELVADDVVFNLNRYREKDAATATNYAQVESVKAVDRYTVAVTLSEPNAWAIDDLFGRAEFIVSPELVAQSGGSLGTTAIGTGPFILKKWASREGGTLVRNPDYWKKDRLGNVLPYLDGVEFKIINEIATRIAAFRTGQLHNPGGITVDDAVNIYRSDPRVNIYKGAGSSHGMAFNTKKAPWNDVRVRRAFGMALDKEKAINSVAASSTFWQYNMPLPWELISDEPFTPDKLGPYYKFNPTEAKKLLTEAGFADGKIKVASPMPVSTGAAARVALTLVIQQLYKDQGIDFGILPQDSATYNTAYYQRVHEDLATTHQITGDFSINWYAQNKFKVGAIQNSSFIDNPDVEKTIRDIKITTDPAKLRTLGKSLWDFETNGAWTIWWPTEYAIAVYDPKMKNLMERRGSNQRSRPEDFWMSDATRTSP